VSNEDLTILPKDLGGVNTPVYLNNNLMYGYYIYTPSGYSNNTYEYPLLVFLHGSGQVGNSKVTQSDLQRVNAYGPGYNITQNKWAPRYPMIVVSPQTTNLNFDADSLNTFINYIVNNYRINPHRIYLTGLSLGGAGTFTYLATYPNNNIAAAVPMSSPYEKRTNINNLLTVPIWTFVGGADANASKLVTTIDMINQLKPIYKAKITIFPGVGHNCWDLVYSGSGMGSEDKNYDLFNMSIYDWMFQYKK
ncbi:MAG: dienelactone hydrolase family protein, partial [Bacteroidota bacterium]|nr:dienelactone hydrolase family protein [Bacteroidota bacterium]